MPKVRASFTCVAVDGAAYLLGGIGADGNVMDAVERYDPFVETWSTPTRLPTPRYRLSAAVIGERVFTVGGVVRNASNAKTSDLVEIMDTGRL
jgi:N-acetylneuraminic acid mutarotase